MELVTNIDQLRSGLRAEEAIDRAEAVEALGRMGVDAAPAAVDLVRAIADSSETVREWATNALENLGPPPAQHEDELIGLARTGSTDQAYWSVTLLGRLESPGEEAIRCLADTVVAHHDCNVCQRAAWALGNLGQLARPALPQLQAATRHDDPRLVRLAGRAIEQIG